MVQVYYSKTIHMKYTQQSILIHPTHTPCPAHTDIEHSPDSKQREESAYLLGSLIRAAPRLVLPYIAPVLTALVGKLKTNPTGQQAALAPGATGVQGVYLDGVGGGEDVRVGVRG